MQEYKHLINAKMVLYHPEIQVYQYITEATFPQAATITTILPNI
jgi:hypothetical protein